MSVLIKFEELAEWIGYKRPCDVKKALDKQGVKYFYDKNKRPITTIDALNSNLIDKNENDENEWEKGFS